MKKIITILLTCICISNLSTLAIEGKTDIKNLSNEELLSLYEQTNKATDLRTVNLYDFFYTKGEYSFSEFNPLTESEILSLNKDSKKIYKKVVKSEKYYQKALKSNSDINKEIKFLHKAIKYNPENYNAVAQLSEAYLANNNYDNAITYALFTIGFNKHEFNYVYAIAGYAYHFKKNYQESIKYIDKYLKFSDNVSYFRSKALYCQALNYFELKNYTKAISYADLSLKEKQLYDKSACVLLKYSSYLGLNNKKLAKQEAWKLIQMNSNAENYLRIAYCTDNQSEKLDYLKKVKSFYKEPKDIFNVNYEIAKIEQNKINNAHKAIGIYSPKPEWSKISNENVGTITYWNNRQDEFFEATNACIANYKGANLAKCFESVINDEKEKTAQLKKTIYEAQMLYAQQQQVSAMQYNNYLQQQRNYQLSRPRYTNTTITPIGNTYYMNSYSY